ncbi:calmodulin [Schistosoma bovis]|uniref:Calmodulin n=1 Tax=Schistosoma bovis TaxID=6184 RepID=A0A430QES1_SCHBO|nr:calmodulin [Schistosoma bovis]
MAFDEFVRLLSNESDAHEEVSATREAFEDNDGYITASELRQVMTRVGHNCSEIEVQEMLSEADQDGDGKVTYEGQKKYKCLKVYCFAISSYSIPIIVPI